MQGKNYLNGNRSMKAFITNLGRYNEGYLVGKWVKLPVDDETLDKVLTEIGINEQYEEYFITDYENEFVAIGDVISEYSSVAALNKLAQRLEVLSDADADKLGAVLEYEACRSVSEVIDLLDELDEFDLLPDVEDDEDLGYYYVEEYGSIDITQSKAIGSTVAKTDGSTLKHKLKHKTKTNTKTNTDTMCVSPLETSEEGAAKPQHTHKRFEKPSLEDIKAYCQERNNSVDPEKFFDFYESKGWMIGKNRMKDWKSAVRTWERKEQTEIPRQKKSDVKPDSELTEEDKEFAKWWAENLGGG